MQQMTNQMLFSGKLVLVANTLPLYNLVMLHIHSDDLNREDDDQQVIEKVHDMITNHMAMTRDQQTKIAQPLLFYYRMRNLISVFTNLLIFMLCKSINKFKIPQ